VFHDSEEFYKAQANLVRADAYDKGIAAAFSPQTQAFIAAIVSGMPPLLAGDKVGMPAKKALELAKNQAVIDAVAHYRDEFSRRIHFGVEEAHHMYMSAYRKAATAGEMIKATSELVKLHRVMEKTAPSLADGSDPNAVNQRSLENMSKEKLMRLAKLGMESLIPEPDTTK
jgi:hypothetical protein